MNKKLILLKSFIHLSCLGTLFYHYYFAIFDDLGGDPVEAILHFTGIGALNLLLLTLTLTPLAKKFRLPIFIQVRRLIGLYSFFYALCHVVSFLAFEVQFDWSLFINEVFKRPYIFIGMFAFILLTLLAITSLTVLRRKMGKSWQSLHNSIYFIVIIVIWHFYWSVKSDVVLPLYYVVISLFLLSFRFTKIKQLMKRKSRSKR